jgi:murein DD-endopeptidase MepM/ murein hydrolase activator NlpD
MPRITYIYNSYTCRYEPQFDGTKRFARKVVFFVFLSAICAVTVFITYSSSFYSLQELWLQKENKALHGSWKTLQKRTERANLELARLIDKDDNTYRVILDTSPLPPTIRGAGTGGSERNNPEIKKYELIQAGYKKIDKLKRQITIETQSFDEIGKILNDKIAMWASYPAIQPIDNRQLNQLHLTYGPRMHPLYGVIMDHKGLDFTAEEGTPVYATGDGRVGMAYFSDSYGKVIFINHGYGLETRYAHLSQFATAAGESVKRGQVIGYVGNTGTSVSSHLHYEVLINGEHTNPINFFQRDLSNEEYQRLIEEASTSSVVPLD